MQKRIFVALILITAAILTNCSVRPQLLDESFDYPTIQQEGAAILPVGGDLLDRNMRKFIGNEFERVLTKKYPDVKVIGVEKSGALLVEYELIDDYNKFIETFQMTEIIEPKYFDDIQQVVGHRYLIIPIVQTTGKEQHDKGGYKYTMSLESQVWDNAGEKMVFRVLTFGEDTPSTWIFDFGKMEDAVKMAVKKAVSAFPKPDNE